MRRLTPLGLGGLTALAALLTYSLGLAVYLGPLYAIAVVLLVVRSRAAPPPAARWPGSAPRSSCW